MKKLILSLIVLGVILSPVFSSASPSVEYLKKFTGPVMSRAYFGSNCDLTDDTIVISAMSETVDLKAGAGAVYIFSKDRGGPGKWGLVKRRTAADVGTVSEYGSFGMGLAISNDIVVVSHPFADIDGTNNAGEVYILGRNVGGDDNWGIQQVLRTDPLVDGLSFGYDVDICGQTIVVSANGCAYIYEPDSANPGDWKPVKQLIAQNESGVPEGSAGFGVSVDLSDETLAVGSSNGPGYVYLFERNTGGDENWGIVKKLVAQSDDGAPDIQLDALFGGAVALCSDLLLVGAPNMNAGAQYVGAAYIYSKDKGGANQWGIVKKLIPVRESGKPYYNKNTYFGRFVSFSGDLALVSAEGGVLLFSKSQSDIGTWGIVKTIGSMDTEAKSGLAGQAAVYGDYCIIGAMSKDEGVKKSVGAAYYFKIPNIVSPEGCADKTVSPTATQPAGTTAIVTSVTKRVKTTAEVKEEHQTPGMDSMLGANVYEFNATVTAGKVAYFCFNSSSLGERKAEEVALFKLFPNKESKSFTYSSGKNPSEEGYFWITDEGNSGQYIDPKTILVGARTYTVNYSVKDNGEYDLDDTAGVIHDPVVPGTSGGSGDGTGCVLNPQAGFSVELCALFVVGLLGIIARGIVRYRVLKKCLPSLIVLGVIVYPTVCLASLPVELIKKMYVSDAGPGLEQADTKYGYSVAINEDTAAITVPKLNAVYLYSKDVGGDGTWGYLKRININGVYKAALSQNYMAVTSTVIGRTFVFNRNTGGTNNWGEVAQLGSSTYSSVAVCENIIVVGSAMEGVEGLARIYIPDPDNPGQWKFHKALIPQDENGVFDTVGGGLQFGSSVAVSEDVIAVGGIAATVDTTDVAGKVYVYYRNADGANNWGIVKNIHAQKDDGTSDTSSQAYFGFALSMSGDLLLVGARDTDIESVDSVGTAYIYSKDKNGADQWGVVKKLRAVRDDGTPSNYQYSQFGKDVSISGDLALVASNYGAYLFSKSQSDIGNWGIVEIIGDSQTEPYAELASSVSIHGDYSIVGSSSKDKRTLTDPDAPVFFPNPHPIVDNVGAAYLLKTPNIVSPEGCADKTVSPTATQPAGTSAIVTSVSKKVKTTAQLKEEHQTPGMDSMLGANVYEFNATVTAGKVAYFCFNSSSLGERAAEDVALFKLFPDKESKSFTYSSGKNPSEEGYFWITDEGNSGQYIDPKTILVGARTYTVNYSVKDNGEYDLDDTAGVIHDPVVPGTSGGSGDGTGCVLNPQAGFSMELCALFVVGLLGICARRVSR
ncbi:FG-GAP repeat protein [Maridesulfovibrio salexigens]|uniref:Integrin alpha beta-propellor repeat protein n=1 Tax=Maridesulfovibrio salexigens (strain ATCC 14822 / DSM 2638 / NCIMB 8403 / VKM B-1763) TaxID=526222 RepID=C6BV13_MARSD|nr:FG-GAP repeat protein [Maridesulfovibrio salexigens]ACS78150.1 Integrin alpha beta-propellor repeat protein [Maridesulfovibrio salexigens DSM 2638]